MRAAYDEEAARLAKIHSIEFPTYKYQPKPRTWPSPLTSSAAASTSYNECDQDDSPPTQVPMIITARPQQVTILKSPVPLKSLSSITAAHVIKIKPEPPSTPPPQQKELREPGQKSKNLIRDIQPAPPPSKLMRLAEVALKPEPPSSPERVSSPSSTPSPPPRAPSVMQVEQKAPTPTPATPIVRIQPQQQKSPQVPPPKLVATVPQLQTLIAQLTAAQQQQPQKAAAPAVTSPAPVTQILSIVSQPSPAPQKIVTPAVSVVQQQPPPTPAVTLQSIMSHIANQHKANANTSPVLQNLITQPKVVSATTTTPINAAAATTTTTLQAAPIIQQVPPAQSAPNKPCVLLTPISSDIGQQAVISCGQSSSMPTLLTYGNTVYVALTVLQTAIPPNATITGAPCAQVSTPTVIQQAAPAPQQPTSVATSSTQSSTSNPISKLSLADLARTIDMSPLRTDAGSRLAELLKAATAASSSQ